MGGARLPFTRANVQHNIWSGPGGELTTSILPWNTSLTPVLYLRVRQLFGSNNMHTVLVTSSRVHDARLWRKRWTGWNCSVARNRCESVMEKVRSRRPLPCNQDAVHCPDVNDYCVLPWIAAQLILWQSSKPEAIITRHGHIVY